MKILVTGGAGFIGSHLCERLVKDGHEVRSIDNYLTGSPNNHVKDVIYHNLHTMYINRVNFIPDLIYHLGEYSRVEQSFADTDLVFDSNVIGTRAVFEYARKNKIKIIYAGSSTKFGDHGTGANSSPYAWSKSSNTQLIQNYADWYGIDYAITYFYNVYGPREIATGSYATVIAKFLEMTKRGEQLIVTAPGNQERNFTHVLDIVDGLVLVGMNGHGDGYGIGSNAAYSILEVANMISRNVKMGPPAKGNRITAELHTDFTRALGWKPTRDLAQYLLEQQLQ